ncbi:hypothetical protein C8J57DRAFT_1612678 [Mycena rebaudengoi]|nr:hypothetical protein C8J57DRAFT_1612678 [Mycena rebaudengoi]
MQNADVPPLQRVAELWFDSEDDNVVLRAEDCLFRVPKEILATRSSVFRDMLSPSHASRETLDGCPVALLQDSAADVTHFLRAIFDSSFFEPPPAKTELSVIIRILRLSHKYDVQYLRRRALLHLDTGFPTSLAEYEISGSETFASDGLDDSLLTIQCASEVGAPWVLPTAFYFLCYSGMRDILAARAWPRLSPADQATAIASHMKQRAACPPVLPFLRIPFTEGCAALDRCSAYKAQYLADVSAWNISDPLGTYRDWTPFEGHVCAYCLKKSKEYHRVGREEVWTNLPAMYGQPAWDVLERMKAEALAAGPASSGGHEKEHAYQTLFRHFAFSIA